MLPLLLKLTRSLWSIFFLLLVVSDITLINPFRNWSPEKAKIMFWNNVFGEANGTEYTRHMDGWIIQCKKKKCSQEWTSQGVTENLPLASANHSSAEAYASHILQRSQSVFKMCAFLKISDLENYIEDEMPTRLPSHKRCK
jgi:hypothetical protein